VIPRRADRRGAVNSSRDARLLTVFGQNGAGVAATDLPASYFAVRSDELAVGERRAYALADLGLARRLYHEQGPHVHVSANPLCARVVRRERGTAADAPNLRTMPP
jgi:hypothetical protein